MVAKADIILIAPELSTLSDALFTQIIADASMLIDSLQFGNVSEIASKYLCAHLLTLVNQSSSGGINSDLTTNVSEQAGRVSVSKAKANFSVSNATRWDLTKYGMMFWQLTRTRPNLGGFVV